jgi:hypothetical protein
VEAITTERAHSYGHRRFSNVFSIPKRLYHERRGGTGLRIRGYGIRVRGVRRVKFWGGVRVYGLRIRGERNDGEIQDYWIMG